MKDGICFSGDFIPVVDTMSHHPKDVTISGNQQPNVLFLPLRKLLVHKEITQEFGAFHAQRMESVAMSPMAQGQREPDLVGIQLRHIGRLVNDEIGSFLKLGETKMDG